MTKTYLEFIELAKEANQLQAVENLLDWDQEVVMPADGVKDRAMVMATISKLTHEKLTSNRIKTLLDELKGNETLTKEQAANVREVAWAHHRAAAVPAELVKRLAKTKSEAFQAWTKARKNSNFKVFEPYLFEIVDMKRKEAEYIGYEDVPYDALLDGFEPGFTCKQTERLFSGLRVKLVDLVTKIVNSGNGPNTSFVTVKYDIAAQKKFNTFLAGEISYDFKRGRIDEAAHPFTTGTLNDCRITTRYHENDPRSAIFSTLHEGGHALYEQGYLQEHAWTPLANPISYGIHESQSRMWENLVGRSLPFWEHYFPKLREAFPKQLEGRTARDFYAAANDVKTSLIRVEADEATYNLHVLLRFEMERDLFSGNLEVAEAPQLWNERMEEYLGQTVPDDAQGILQDIHWSQGYFGYFPSYTLGNLYAAQFFKKAKEDMPHLMDDIGNGKLRPLLDWLRENIHRKGRLLRAGELVEEVTGSPLNEDLAIEYMREKFGSIYGI